MLDKLLLLSLATAFVLALAQNGNAATPDEIRTQADQLVRDGNYRDAAELLSPVALDAANSPKDAERDLQKLANCYSQLGESAKILELLENAQKTWPESWRILSFAASRLAGLPTAFRGRIRPHHSSFDDERNRVVALQLMLKAEKFLGSPADPASDAEKANFYRSFAAGIVMRRQGGHAWRLTALTNLDEIPETEDPNAYWSLPQRNAPVDADGNPVYYRVPASWDAAANDGERWRWVLERLGSVSAVGRSDADLIFGRFLLSQFGVHTATQNSPLSRNADIGGDTGPFAVRTLGEDETIARLATGLKRFALPDEFNHITALRRVADGGDPRNRFSALADLAHVFENRQQYNKAVSFWDQVVALARKPGETARPQEAENALKRITGNNGLLETGPVAPAGSRTSLSYLFRNGKKVELVAKRLDERKLLSDIRDLMRKGSDELYSNYSIRQPEMLGRKVVEDDAGKYIAETVATWDVALEPLADYYSRRVQIELPFSAPGCYLVEARMRDGNVSRIVLWIADLALVRKSSGPKQLFFVADAVSGEPVPGADITFSGFEGRYNHNENRTDILRDEFAERVDDNGLAVVDSKRLQRKEWLISAETGDGRFAYTGFDNIWVMDHDSSDVVNESCFVITDRPVYRPDQEVQFKLWYGKARYAGRAPKVEGISLPVTIRNPRGETIYEKTLITDEFGGVADTLALKGDAPLGEYYIFTDRGGGASFRLEEYKKPEFEVSLDTPAAAVTLGDSVQLKVRAKYYYGAPVTDGKVAYKILRTTHRQNWNPPWRWDWLYGAGSWQSSYDYSWYPGFRSWGRIGYRLPPHFFAPEQPEVVAEGEGELDADGVFRVTLDTAPAKELFGDQDHSYAVTAEVTDKSRRTIVGSGKVVAARQPFSIAVWTNRGFYPAGQEVVANVHALLPMGAGVKAKGKATLYRITYDDQGTPRETAGSVHDVETGADGSATVRFSVDKAGQYRLACRLEDERGNTEEGGCLLTVRGETGEGDFRFTALELVPDKRDYRPGETLRLAVNSENKGGLVLLFPRAERDEVGKPTLVRLDNGSQVIDLPVGRADQPNFFCEAITVYKGRVYRETREIFVPPADRTLSVEVTSDKESYLPGDKAEFKVKVTDANGEPAPGQCVVTVYDKSVEYISGGSNVGDIRSQFWGWKRHFNSMIVSSLDKAPYAPEKRGDTSWEPIGIFGSQEADWNDDAVYVNGKVPRPRGMAMGYGGADNGIMMKSMRAAPMMASAAPPPSAAPMADMVMMEVEAPMQAEASFDEGGALTGGGGAMAEPQVRSEFADTALWIAALETDDDGNASFTVDMPENLTAWKTRTWVMGEGTRVGDGDSQVETKKNVIVRPQTPRFLTQKDQVILSANLHNYLPRAKDARAELVLEGGLLEADASSPLRKNIRLDANGEARVDWLVNALRPGTARIVMKLLTDEESDAAEIELPVIVHGARRVESFGGVLRGERNEETIRFRIPEERLAEQSRLEFTFSPSIAATMLDALPFLIEYPYGCTEQTLNRFLPVVMTRGFLDKMGVSLADAKAMLDSRRDDPQSAQWRQTHGDPRANKKDSPVFDDAELALMVKQGVERLTSMQNSDGGWGWFSGSGERSWPHTTSVIVNGLMTASANGAAVPAGVIDSGVNWLRGYQQEQITRLKIDPEAAKKDDSLHYKRRADNLDAFVYMILANDGRRPLDPDMRDFLYRDRLELSRSALAMFGLALHREKATNALEMVMQNLSQYLHTDPETGTAWLGTPDDGWWWWYNDNIETQAWYLKLLSRIEPTADTTSGVAKYILRNRKNGSYWRSTRDTAYCIEALAEYAVASGESKPDMTVELHLDGKKVMERRLTAKNVLEDNRFVLEGVAVEAGEHELRLVRTGGGNVYYGGSADVFSLEDPIRAAGLEVKIDRAFYKLIPEEKKVDMASSTGIATAGKVEHYRRQPLPGVGDKGASTTPLASGDLVEVELTIQSKNDYEYLVFEDMKAAGLEAVELRSGYSGNRLGAYVEYRDQKVVLFVRWLPKGTYTISYRFRAEIPGAFSALPTFGGGMYATDLFANSDEMKIRIGE